MGKSIPFRVTQFCDRRKKPASADHIYIEIWTENFVTKLQEGCLNYYVIFGKEIFLSMVGGKYTKEQPQKNTCLSSSCLKQITDFSNILLKFDKYQSKEIRYEITPDEFIYFLLGTPLLCHNTSTLQHELMWISLLRRFNFRSFYYLHADDEASSD